MTSATLAMAGHQFRFDLRAFLRNRQARFFTLAVLVGIGWAAYGANVPARTAPALVVTAVVGALSFCCLGYALASVIGDQDAAQPITQAIMLPLYFVSGVFVAAASLPHWLVD